MIIKVKDKLFSNRLSKNVYWIFWGNILHAILAFLLNIFVARMLTLNDNGLLTYASSWVAFFSSVGTLGFNGIISREFSKNESKFNEYIWSCTWLRVIFALGAIVTLQAIVRISAPEEQVLHLIVLCQSLTILFGSMDLFVYWYRYKNKAAITAQYRICSFLLAAVWRILAIGVFHNLIFYAIGVSIETLLFVFFLYRFYRQNYTRKIQIKSETMIRMIKMSYPFVFSAILSTIYGQADKIMLKNMVDNNAVALYNASTTLAGLVVIVPTTLIEGFRPDIMDAKCHNELLYQRRLRQLYALVFWTCMVYGVFITVFAKQIILLLYGKKYLGSADSLALIVWYTSFSYFGAINNVYMVAENKQKWVQFITLGGALANVVLNYFLIPVLGIIGAALSSLLTQIFANFVMMMIIRDLRQGFRIMIQGIILKEVKE